MNMTEKLNNRLNLYGMIDVENSLGEITRKPAKIKNVFCNILPNFGGTSKIGNTNIEDVSITHKIRCRKRSIPTPEINMHFKDDKGSKYEIIAFYPDYKNNEFWEFKCTQNFE